MAKLKLKDLKEGMVLADHVMDQNGMMILSAGQKITSKYIKTFRAWGIAEVDVEGNKERKIEESLPEKNLENISAEVKKKVDELFRYADKDHPAMAELMELCILRKMESS